MSETTRSKVEEYLAENVIWILIWILGFAVIAGVVVALAFIINFHAVPIAGKIDAWGQFGDYLGGVLNPVFGFLSVIGLLVALVLQMKELKASREALSLSQKELELSRKAQTESAEALKLQNDAIRRQGFEQTFFAWFQSYRNLLQEVEAPTAEIPQGGIHSTLSFGTAPTMHKGGAALKQFFRRFLTEEGIQIHFSHLLSEDQWKTECAIYAPSSQSINTSVDPGAGPHISRKYLIPADSFKRLLFNFRKTNGPDLVIKAVLNGWYNLYQKEGHQLGVLFRALYRLIKWIDEQPENGISTADKWQYVSIVRSQLSRHEQILLFYNGISVEGSKFRPLIEKYALFDNLGTESASENLHFLVQWKNPSGASYAETAFQSEAAKALLKI